MASLSTSNDLPEASSAKISTHPKPDQLKKSSKPLRFRSFEAFYQHYSKKQTYDNSKKLIPPNQAPIHNTTLKDKNESSKSAKSEDSKVSKPTFTYRTEDYDIKGRVKRLCEIFQKAHNDSDFRRDLEGIISKNKGSKLVKVPDSVESDLHILPNQTGNLVSDVKADLKHPYQSEQPSVVSELGSDETKLKSPVHIYTKRDQNTRPDVNLSPLKPRPDLVKGSENSIFNISVNAEGLLKDKVVIENKLEAPSPKAPSPRKSSGLKQLSPGKSNSITRSSSVGFPLAGTEKVFSNEQSISFTSTQGITPNPSSDTNSSVSSPKTVTSTSGKQTIGVEQLTGDMDRLSFNSTALGSSDRLSIKDGSYTGEFVRRYSRSSSGSDNDALIDDILNRFIHDPEFCDSFFNKLESFNLENKSDSEQFSKIIDELQFLVENDNLDSEETERQKKQFDWFFNQPKVFDFSLTERASLNAFSSTEQSDSRDSLSLMGDDYIPGALDELNGESVSSKMGSRNRLTSSNLITDVSNSKFDAPSDLETSIDLELYDEDLSLGEVNYEMSKHFDWIKTVK